jgi:uncharacterized membrane protein
MEIGTSFCHTSLAELCRAGRHSGGVPRTYAVESTPSRWIRMGGRLLLGLFLASSGLGHLTVLRQEFHAQVPPWFPLDPDFVVVASGVVEITLGLALIVAPRRVRPLVGWVVAAFFVAVFPGNISQYVTGTSAFGLNTDTARLVRLFFQPLLVVWALWSTAAWQAWRHRAGRSVQGGVGFGLAPAEEVDGEAGTRGSA